MFLIFEEEENRIWFRFVVDSVIFVVIKKQLKL